MNGNEDKIYALALSITSSPAFNRIWDLISTCPPAEIFGIVSNRAEMSTQGYIAGTYGSGPVEAAKLIFDECSRNSIRILDYWDADYPALLRQIVKPPVVLYCKGNLYQGLCIAVVGTRKTDKRSSEIARRVSSELALSGYGIASGMAIGIDREAHLGALENNFPTIGVLANGIDIIYPSQNRDIYGAILKSERSCVISEYPPKILAGKWTFVRRNRIISGLSAGTVVVKAGERSGALITARYALEQNREVFACPGHTFDRNFTGCHNLIRNGAVLVSETDDILRELKFYSEKNILKADKRDFLRKDDEQLLFCSGDERKENEFGDGTVEKRIIEVLSAGEMDIDGLVRLLECSANEVNEAIIMLELSRAIMRDGNVISKL
ncbi:MAG: DNA-processing protein DprA [Spirochaetes bacterium]|jgi:DNA processing protein|nr:DNA-processing protein DprA [Spirochaetota bacterium]